MIDKVRYRDKITILRNLSSYTGSYESKMGSSIKFLIIAIIPAMIYVFGGLFNYIPWYIFVPVWGVIILRLAMIIPGEEKKRLAQYRLRQKNEYSVAKDLIELLPVREDGMIEYLTGTVAYIITGFPRRYIDYKDLSKDMEEVFSQFEQFEFDIHLYNADEIDLRRQLPNLSKYIDKDVISDRINLYESAMQHTKKVNTLYRYVFILKTSKYNFRALQHFCYNFPTSKAAQMFNDVKVCKRDEVYELMNRDATAFIDILSMLQDRYASDFINNSGVKIIGYDDNILNREDN